MCPFELKYATILILAKFSMSSNEDFLQSLDLCLIPAELLNIYLFRTEYLLQVRLHLCVVSKTMKKKSYIFRE